MNTNLEQYPVRYASQSDYARAASLAVGDPGLMAAVNLFASTPADYAGQFLADDAGAAQGVRDLLLIADEHTRAMRAGDSEAGAIWGEAEARLREAFRLHYLTPRVTDEAAPSQAGNIILSPVINVSLPALNVAPPSIHLEAVLPEAPAPTVVVSLPARRSITDIERDRAGNIVRAEQIEVDA